MPSPATLNRLLSLLKVVLAFLLAGLYGFYFYDRFYVGVILLAILLSGSLPFVLSSSAVGLFGAWLFPQLVEAGLSASVTESFLFIEVLLAAPFLYRRRLVSPALQAFGKRSHEAKWLARYCVALWILAVLLIVSVSFVTFPARVHVALALLTILVGWGLWPKTAFFTGGWSSYAKNTCLLAVSLLFSIVLLEMGARAFVYPDRLNDTYFKPHPEYLYTLLPGAEVRRGYNNDSDGRSFIDISISSQGLRDREYAAKEPREFRIALLGDSFTFGATVQPEHTLSTFLEEKLQSADLPLRVSVYNAGMGATGPWQHRGFLRDTGFAFEPDLVVHQLFLGNDVCDTLHQYGEHLQAYNRQQAFNVARWQNTWQDLTYQYRRFRVDAYLHAHSKFYGAVRDAVGPLNLYEFLLRGTRFLTPIETSAFPKPAPRRQTIEVNLEEWYPKLTRGWDQMILDIESTQAMCRERGIDYIVYAIPTQFSVIDESWDEVVSQYPAWRYIRGRGIEKLQKDLEARKIQSLNILDKLRAHPDPRQLYFLLNGHLTPEGNRVVTDLIADYLLAEYFPARDSG